MTPTSTKPGDEAAGRGEPREAVAARVKVNAWVLAAVAIAFYLGFIAWNYLRGSVG